jgi:hypothetical protein
MRPEPYVRSTQVSGRGSSSCLAVCDSGSKQNRPESAYPENTRTGKDSMATSNLGNAKTQSELLFEEYLRTHGHSDWKDEAPIEGKPTNPDYRLEFNGTSYFFEIKEFEAQPVRLGSGYFDPYGPLREKVNKVTRQFKHYKEFSCSVVLANPNMAFVIFEPWAIMGTMLGNIGFEVAIGEKAEPVDKVFTSGGKMVNDKQKKPQNTTISSIIVLQPYPLRQDLIRINVKQNEEKLRRRLYMEEILEIHDGIPDSPDLRVVRVVVYENPFARIPLSRELFCGNYDERFGNVDGRMSRIFSGEGIKGIEQLLGKSDV